MRSSPTYQKILLTPVLEGRVLSMACCRSWSASAALSGASYQSESRSLTEWLPAQRQDCHNLQNLRKGKHSVTPCQSCPQQLLTTGSAGTHKVREACMKGHFQKLATVLDSSLKLLTKHCFLTHAAFVRRRSGDENNIF